MNRLSKKIMATDEHGYTQIKKSSYILKKTTVGWLGIRDFSENQWLNFWRKGWICKFRKTILII